MLRRAKPVGTIAPDGLQLSASINATHLAVGQELNISVSLFNTLPTTNAFFPQQSFDYSAPGAVVGNWTFYGIPVSTWADCSSPYDVDWPQPIEVVVLSGNYTAQELPSTPNTTAPFTCGVGGAAPEFTFEPNNNIINMTGFFSGGVGSSTLGQFQLASHFTATGYWNVTSLAENNPDTCVPAVPNHCSPPQSTPFAPGVYTIGVSDEWGQYDVLHFQVSGSG